jgi:hypothetical protein
MMMVALAWLAAAGVGLVIVMACGVALSLLELAGLAPLVGAGVLTFGFCVAAIHGAPISTTTTAAVITVVLAIAVPLAVWRVRRSGGRSMLSPVGRPTVVAVPWIVVVGLLTLYAFAMAWYWPPAEGDSLTVWVLKGRDIRDTGSIAAAAAHGAGLFYPLNLPLQVAAAWPALGPEHIQLVFPPYFVGLILVVAGFLSRRIRSDQAWLFTMLVASTPVLLGQASTSMSDIPFAFYYVSSVLMLLRFLEAGSLGFAALGGVLLALAGWTRADGLLYLAVNVVAFGLFGMTRLSTLRTLAGAAIVVALFALTWWPWTQYAEAQGWGGHFETTGGAAVRALARGDVHWNALSTVLGYFQERWVALSVWGSVWLTFAASLLNARALRSLVVLLVVIALNVGGLLFTYYAFAYYRPDVLQWAIDVGFDRMASHFAPLLWCYAALSLSVPRSLEQVVPQDAPDAA